MYNPKLNPMKALKITLLLALFVVVSSQMDKKPSKESENTYQTISGKYDLLAHTKREIRVPEQG